MDNNNINKLVFDTLSARKSILIEGIGTVVVVRKGSNLSNPKKKNDFPRYELIINNSPASVDLNGAIGDSERYKSWFSSVCEMKRGGKVVTIPDCVEIKMKSYVVKSIIPSAELDLQLNPFMPKKKSGHGVSVVIISILILVLVGAALFLILDYADINRSNKPVEQNIIIPGKVAYIPEQDDILGFDTTEFDTSEVVDSVKIDTIPDATVVKPVVKAKDGVTEPINGASYMVIGSFRTLSEANGDKIRLLKIYPDIVISTTMKSKGGYINYIYWSQSFDEVMSLRDDFASNYPKIKGIWVYQFLN